MYGTQKKIREKTRINRKASELIPDLKLILVQILNNQKDVIDMVFLRHRSDSKFVRIFGPCPIDIMAFAYLCYSIQNRQY